MTPAEVRETGFSLGQASGTMARLLVYGTPDDLRARLEALAVEAQADELIVMTLSHAPEPRLRSYELLAQAFGLE
jgi:alkanesulfonate monooxygenase SsuD/methylene tetrahydromethanopterin reductase-like flavin-dependent oxidoreductase (luciferase family)